MVLGTDQGRISDSAAVELEFHAAMSSAVLVDRSVVGKLRVSGAEGLDLLHRLSTNDIRGLKAFTSAGTVFTTEKGHLVDFARVLVTDESILLMSSPLLPQTLKQWIEKYIIMEEIEVFDITTDLAMYSIIGPQAIDVGERLLDASLPGGGATKIQVAGTQCIVDVERDFRVGRLNVLVPKESSGTLWAKLKEEMQTLGFPVMRDKAYEVFRIFHGIPLGESEINDAFNPYEVGLSPWISATKGCYVGQEVIARLDTYDKVQRQPVRINFRHVPQTSPQRLHLIKDGEDTGVLTSIANTPVKEEYFGIGVVRKNRVSVGDTLTTVVHELEYEGIVSTIFSHSMK